MLNRFLQFVRLLQINAKLIRYGLNRSMIGEASLFLRWSSYLNPWSFREEATCRGKSLRLLLEKLGPVFVKFGQVLSTRPDLVPPDIAEELTKLQDQISPFPGPLAKQLVEHSYQKNIRDCFQWFDIHPLACASIAQVHAATLHDGSPVIVKILRPGILKIIQKDLALMYSAARFAERFWKKSPHVKPIALVSEFEQIILNELDLLREAANASQLRRNFQNSSMMYVPKIYWAYAKKNVLVMERVSGIRVTDKEALLTAGVDVKKLAEYGVEIFFTQVLRDSFFHADMHPGNLFIDIQDPKNPRYIGVDFGIMGSLSAQDQYYLAHNLLYFFHRDYRKIALLHIESGWVPPTTRIDQFEAAIRSVCEPIAEKPLKDISFGQLLLNLLKVADQFHMTVQPQLLLLQKTLLNIEGLGRQIYAELNLWETAKPIIEKWIRDQTNIKTFATTVLKNLPEFSQTLIQLPLLLKKTLIRLEKTHEPMSSHRRIVHRCGFWRGFVTALFSIAIVLTAYVYL